MEAVRKYWMSFLTQGLVFVFLGLIAISFPWIFTFGIEMLTGCIFVIAAIIIFMNALQSKDAPGFYPSIISAIFFAFAGFFLLANPVQGVITLTFLLTIFFLLDGCTKMLYAVQMNLMRNWIWLMFAGIAEIAIALIIWNGWPSTAIWAIGLLVGVNLLIQGFAQILIALEAKSA